jgi:hypothetical protein
MWFLLVLALLQPVESGTAPGAEQWWIIVKFFDSPFFGGAEALGPYASKELCRRAGKDLMPGARQFWTASDRAAENRRRRASDARAARVRSAWEKNGRRAGTVNIGTGGRSEPVTYDDRGLETEPGGVIWVSDPGPPAPSAVSGCLRVKP